MEVSENKNFHEAIYFFAGNDVCKEMMFHEFEAVLDGVVGLTDFANKALKAAYVELNPHLEIISCVLFSIGFDKDGFGAGNWNVPLRHLAMQGAPGPNLGAGPIRLVCRSQCSVKWQCSSLWDPITSKDNNTFVTLRDVAMRNRLYLSAESKQVVQSSVQSISPAPLLVHRTSAAGISDGAMDDTINDSWNLEQRQAPRGPLKRNRGRRQHEELDSQSSRELIDERNRLIKLIGEQRDHMQVVKSEHNHSLNEIKSKLRARTIQYNDELARNNRLVESLQAENARLLASNDKLKSQNRALEACSALQAKEAAEREQTELTELVKKHEAIVESRTEEIRAEFEIQAERLEIDLQYREQTLQQLREEISELKADKIRLVSSGANQFLEHLERLGITFIAFHPGAGHMSIPLSQMNTYMANPLSYVSERCNVTEKVYKQWLKHYEGPICMAHLAKDQMCGAKIDRVENPVDYEAGISDRCERHLLS